VSAVQALSSDAQKTNRHRGGSFSSSVLSLTLLRPGPVSVRGDHVVITLGPLAPRALKWPGFHAESVEVASEDITGADPISTLAPMGPSLP
jgi:hypothetical protein